MQENARILSADARPTLLIVDYIANRDREVRDLLHEAARACGERAAPLAVVLLERTFPDWLREELHTYTDPEYVGWRAFLRLATVEKEPRNLPDLAPDDRRDLFEQALDRFAAVVGAGHRPALGARHRPAPTYAELPDAPLYVLLLALLAAAGERVERPTDPEQVLECTWSRERAAWKRHLEPLFRNQPEARLNRAVEAVEDLAVLATLGRAFADPPAAAAFLQAHCRPIPGMIWDELADLLPVLFPRRVPASLIPPVAPDPLADFLLRRRLAERADLLPLALPGPEEAEAEPEEALRAAGDALGVLARLWERAADERGREQVAGWMRAAAGRLAAWPASAWNSLDRALPAPDRTLALRPFLADFYQARLERTPPEAAEERARVLNSLGKALSALGRREEALAATEEAADLYRRLAGAVRAIEQSPRQAFLPDLAGSLNNLGNVLSALGRREEALAATQEAADLYRDLARANPQAVLPNLAASLNNLGLMLSDLGRREEALAATQEAADLYRDLARANPQAFLPDLAGSLNNLGTMLSALGRREEALTATQEAADLYRDLAQANPPAFRPDLATSLNNLGNRLSELGRREEALAAYEEAVRTLLPFFQALPAAFAGWMQTMLGNYLWACREAKREPDQKLVEEVQRILR